MSRRCLLTIYEPQKDPRIVELQVNRSSSEEKDKISVYNEDGTIVQNYQLFVETADNRLIKAKDVPETKSNTLKFWKRWKSDVSCDSASDSLVGDVPLSESAHHFLSTYEINSAKKEKKIARAKDWRTFLAEKKLKNKLKKQRKKELKRFFSETLSKETALPTTSLPLKSSSVVDSAKNAKKKTKRKERCKSVIDTQNESPAVVKRRKPRLRSKRKKKGKNLTAENQTSEPPVLERVIKDESPSIRWKASEPAADFIPVTKSDQKSSSQEPVNYLSFNAPTKDSYKYSKHNASHPQLLKDDFIGISQKAFFLQC